MTKRESELNKKMNRGIQFFIFIYRNIAFIQSKILLKDLFNIKINKKNDYL